MFVGNMEDIDDTPLDRKQYTFCTISALLLLFLMIPFLFCVIFTMVALKETICSDGTNGGLVYELWISAGIFGVWSIPQIRGTFDLIVAATEHNLNRASNNRAKQGLLSWMVVQVFFIYWEMLFGGVFVYKFLDAYPGVHYERICLFSNLPLVFIFLAVCILTRVILLFVGNGLRVELNKVVFDDEKINKEKIVHVVYTTIDI